MMAKDQNRIFSLFENFTKSKPELIKLILSDNCSTILETLCSTFDDSLLLMAQANFRIDLNLIKTYDKFENIKAYLLGCQSLELDVKKEIETLFYGLLEEFGHNHVIGSDLSGIFLTRIIPVSMPIVNYGTEMWERYSFYQDGYLNLRSRLETKKKLCLLQGHVHGAEREIHSISKISSMDCTNTKCTNKTRLITTSQYQFQIEINSRNIARLPLKENKENSYTCNNCKSRLTKMREQVGVQYKYAISYNNRYMCFSLPESTVLPEGMSFYFVGVVGFLERDKYGRVYLNSSEYFMKTSLTCENYIINLKISDALKRKSGFKLEDYLKYCAGILLPFKRTIKSLDVVILIISNIYNTADISETNCCTGSRCLGSDSGEMLNTPSSDVLNTPNPVTCVGKSKGCSNKTIIYSNDTTYIKNIIRSVSNTTLLYSLSSFKTQSKSLENCICLLQTNTKNDEKAMSLADHVFYIEVDQDCYHDYSYSRVPCCSLTKKDIILDQAKVRELKDLFIVQRKIFKNEIEPVKLLKTTEAIYRSISYFGCFETISGFVKRRFRKIMAR